MVKVQWYPGHMEKARREMTEKLKVVDMIIELRDARIPMASANPLLKSMAQGKPRLVILAKRDMADPSQTAAFEKALAKEYGSCMSLDLMHDAKCKGKIVRASIALMKEKRDKQLSRGIRPRAVRAMAVGIPNVGKSTMINRIAGKNTLIAQDRPGVTRSLTWLRADSDLELLDTPGVLWPKFDDEKTGALLAAYGSINDDIFDVKMVAMDAIHEIQDLYPGLLEGMFDADGANPNQMLKKIAEKRLLIGANGQPDAKRAAETFLHDLRKGRIGRLTLERPNAA